MTLRLAQDDDFMSFHILAVTSVLVSTLSSVILYMSLIILDNIHYFSNNKCHSQKYRKIHNTQSTIIHNPHQVVIDLIVTGKVSLLIMTDMYIFTKGVL